MTPNNRLNQSAVRVNPAQLAADVVKQAAGEAAGTIGAVRVDKMPEGGMVLAWIGTFGEMTEVAQDKGCERGPDGKFLCHGDVPESFIGTGRHCPVCVGPGVYVVIEGKDVNLAKLMAESGHGTVLGVADTSEVMGCTKSRN